MNFFRRGIFLLWMLSVLPLWTSANDQQKSRSLESSQAKTEQEQALTLIELKTETFPGGVFVESAAISPASDQIEQAKAWVRADLEKARKDNLKLIVNATVLGAEEAPSAGRFSSEELAWLTKEILPSDLDSQVKIETLPTETVKNLKQRFKEWFDQNYLITFSISRAIANTGAISWSLIVSSHLPAGAALPQGIISGLMSGVLHYKAAAYQQWISAPDRWIERQGRWYATEIVYLGAAQLTSWLWGKAIPQFAIATPGLAEVAIGIGTTAFGGLIAQGGWDFKIAFDANEAFEKAIVEDHTNLRMEQGIKGPHPGLVEFYHDFTSEVLREGTYKFLEKMGINSDVAKESKLIPVPDEKAMDALAEKLSQKEWQFEKVKFNVSPQSKKVVQDYASDHRAEFKRELSELLAKTIAVDRQMNQQDLASLSLSESVIKKFKTIDQIRSAKLAVVSAVTMAIAFAAYYQVPYADVSLWAIGGAGALLQWKASLKSKSARKLRMKSTLKACEENLVMTP
ncbi:MAG: hypothetical protein AB1540_09335 [Bdellovibrionota bacterium]